MNKRLLAHAIVTGFCAVLLTGCATFSEPAFDDAPEGQRLSGVAAKELPLEKKAQPTPRRETALDDPEVNEKSVMSAVDRENSIFFLPASAVVDAAGQRKLVEHAARLKADPSRSVTLVGHTDDLGSPSYNLAIAEQRINAVFAILRAQGVPVTQLRRYGMGSEAMSRACRSAECRALMRRVELDYEP